MTQNDMRDLAATMIRQGRLFKAQGQADLGEALVRRATAIRAFAESLIEPEPVLVPVRVNRR
jgi:hypothetical protein